MKVALFFRFARNRGQGSIEETEIFHFSLGAEGSFLIWGGVILHDLMEKGNPQIVFLWVESKRKVKKVIKTAILSPKNMLKFQKGVHESCDTFVKNCF